MVGGMPEPTCKEGSSKRTKGTHVKGERTHRASQWAGRKSIIDHKAKSYPIMKDHEHLEAEPHSHEKKD